MDPILIVLIVLAVAAVAAGFVTGRSKKTGPQPPAGGQPGERPGLGQQDARESTAQDASTTDRPAGPAAESDGGPGA
jgi:hypothetical protein